MTLEKNLMSFFPLPTPRKSQELVIGEIEHALRENYKYVIVEAPVGSGKSALAMTVARWTNDAHILTPRKSLQDQYFEDFNKDGVVLMKGRSSYFCTYDDNSGSFHNKVIKWVETGSCPQPSREFVTCAEGPCKDKKAALVACTTARNRECPYSVAVQIAEQNDIIIHNFHSFIFQFHFGMKFEKRKVLIIDEAHEVEGIIRGFTTIEIKIPRVIKEEEIDLTKTNPDYWLDFLNTEVDKYKDGSKKKEQVLKSLDSLKVTSTFSDQFVAKYTVNEVAKTTILELIPTYVGKSANSLLFDCGEKVILMSGTIYNKDVYCKSLGIKPEDAYFIRIGSSFPVESRPIYMKDKFMVDTSHSKWNENKDRLVEIINSVIATFSDAKGVIHAPSYRACNELVGWLKNDRVVTHRSDNLAQTLEEFYNTKDPVVLISPACYQGVDFKGDRARFQMILRVPYLNTGDPFIEHKVKSDFPWYNHQALITFGQQTGRVNRGEDDFGVTILVDERFKKFINRNRKVLPKWLLESIKT